MQAGGTSATVSAGVSTSNRGIFPFITAYGVKATTSTSTSSTGTRAVNVNATAQPGGAGRGGRGGAVTYNTTALRSALQTAGVSNATGAISLGTAAQSRGVIFTSPLQWAAYANMSSTDYQKVYSQLTATATGAGAAAPKKALINVNTTSIQVLMCLPGMQESDAEAITNHRQTNTSTDPRDISWILDAMPHTDLQQCAGYLTGSSMVYSGDIVAVSPDGRAFRRVRVVIDGSKTPSYVMYRRDLTGSGWPLSADIQTAMRAGQAPPDVGAAASSSSTSLLGKGI
jgi:DNA uptake protein ComE-like DNA-binding protein